VLAALALLLPAPPTQGAGEEVPRPYGGFSFGYSLAALGDLNGDGAPDFLVGAPYDGGACPTWQDPHPMVHAISGRDGSQLWARTGPESFGQSLAAVADIDGDGRLDFAAGCTGDGVLLCSGADGTTLGSMPLPPDLPAAHTRCEVLALPGPDGEPTTDFAILWRTRWSLPGDARARVDARLERFAASSRESLGQVPLYGREPGESIFSLPDLDGDGHADVAYSVREGAGGWARLNVASGRSGDVLFAFDPQRWTAEQACSVVGLRDRDGDGAADLAVGTCEDQQDGDEEGEAPGAVWILSGREGKVIARLAPEQAHPYFGFALASGGDVNADGVPDLLTTTYAGLGTNGAISAFSGVDGARVRHAELTGDAPPGFRALFVGDVNGDGASDYAVSYLCVFWQPQDSEGVRVFSGVDGRELYTVPAH